MVSSSRRPPRPVDWPFATACLELRWQESRTHSTRTSGRQETASKRAPRPDCPPEGSWCGTAASPFTGKVSTSCSKRGRWSSGLTAVPTATLVMIGDGPDAQSIARLIRDLGLRSVHQVTAYILDPRLVRRYLRAADLYVLPSRHEGFAVAPMEALACAIPVVATDVSGVRELLVGGESSGGRIVPSEDPRALAAAIGDLLANRR